MLIWTEELGWWTCFVLGSLAGDEWMCGWSSIEDGLVEKSKSVEEEGDDGGSEGESYLLVSRKDEVHLCGGGASSQDELLLGRMGWLIASITDGFHLEEFMV